MVSSFCCARQHMSQKFPSLTCLSFCTFLFLYFSLYFCLYVCILYSGSGTQCLGRWPDGRFFFSNQICNSVSFYFLCIFLYFCSLIKVFSVWLHFPEDRHSYFLIVIYVSYMCLLILGGCDLAQEIKSSPDSPLVFLPHGGGCCCPLPAITQLITGLYLVQRDLEAYF